MAAMSNSEYIIQYWPLFVCYKGAAPRAPTTPTDSSASVQQQQSSSHIQQTSPTEGTKQQQPSLEESTSLTTRRNKD